MDPRNPNEIEEDDIEADEGTDAGQIDDDGGDEAQAGQEPQEFEAEERVERPRSQRRDDRVAQELRAEREHRARVEQELQQLRAEREQRQQPQEETEDQFQARIALLEPEDRWNAKFERSERRNARQVALASFAAADRADKAAFDARANTDPIRRKYAPEIEQLLRIERSKGRDIDRESAFYYLRGRAADMNKGKVSQAREQGQRNIERQQARTGGGRGDAAPQQRQQKRFAANDMSPEAVRQRLEQPDAYI